MKHIKVNYKVKYTGETNFSFIKDKIYICVTEHYEDDKLHSLSIIDESEEDYIYKPKYFERIEKSSA